ncbi:G-type lectin S-receptor-like serine/threonine-protein kinase RKS1 isoform X2 [Populus trichocarpa]|uniref:Receptor-like serine/threonine-protein kinase n=1 Tax=Populus trichocarpa TaxID=3694 RepID=A0A2K1R5I9_POPTR|nr:G-type lectin S-receptor-like serine/threonine-protein kinase RKS1 isoform X2 [Populus trichocarpa]|eukprot:XP_024448949.1 G-type lectin S-receptor-like serine/threonine-protein kinase RKS1 isoform X2 [Populus trichocarpa]
MLFIFVILFSFLLCFSLVFLVFGYLVVSPFNQYIVLFQKKSTHLTNTQSLNQIMNPIERFLSALFFFLVFPSCLSIDIIAPNQSIKDGDVLVSSGQSYELGFFSSGIDSTRRYVGIWYHKVSERTVVWVANRDNPINGTSGFLAINKQGNLVIYENNRSSVPVWSTNVAASSMTNCTAQLKDSGNLVLVQQDSKRVLWQSFDHGTDTLLPGMKLGLDLKIGLNRFLSSWKSKDDPGTGNILYGLDPSGFPQFFLYKGQTPLWRGGPWTGLRWSGIPEMIATYIFNATFVNSIDEVSIFYTMNNPSIISRVVVNESGGVQRLSWDDRGKKWIGIWSAPKEPCDTYRQCGPNSNCDPYQTNKFMCKCLPGFEPKSPQEWYLRDWSGGCVRKPKVSTCHGGEGFVEVARVKLPDTSIASANMSLRLKECEQECLRNCSCTAYASADERGLGCLRWYGDLVDTRTFSDVGQEIYIRVDRAELAKYEKSGPLANKGIQAILIVSVGVTLFLIIFLVCWFVKKRRKARDRKRRNEFPLSLTSRSNSWRDLPIKEFEEGTTSSDLPLFDLSVMAAATNNFSDANKLGEGGFGSVYKGLLHDGKEIAVKRLAKYSGQGINEFRNEVELIAKLQHRNLVRILGCCIQGREKMLIYEYLPNKSLDSFIFNEPRRSQLDWSTRHNIICGIARGILYLHEDSRLRIIHRDLKASNVLLDASMNPKISDFGMARIFGVDQIEANTNRVVGTYGYMSPEYAMQGLFSVKSDVYSFGILLLEVITGRKNSNFYDESNFSSLVGYVWDLWREGRALELVDTLMGDSYPEDQVLRCIQIGLLCVQESAMDRPSMSNVVFMLSNDTTLPSPKQPAFILKKSYNSGDPSTSEGSHSINEVTITMLGPR